jgi:trigger factor
MATVTREHLGTLHEKVTVKLSKEDYLPGFEKSLKHYAKNVNIPGFRKGNVPSGMIRKMYGQSLYQDEVLRAAGTKLEAYLKEEKVAIFAQPMILPDENLRLDMNAPGDVDFSFEIGLKPEFEIPALKQKPTLTKYIVSVADKMIDDEVERIRRKYGKVEEQESVTAGEDIIYGHYVPADEAEAEPKEDTVLLEKLPAKLQTLLQGKKAGETVSE